MAERLRKLPPYLFAEIDKKKREARARGADLIDMGIGDPDLPTPPHVIEALKRGAENPASHRYPDYEGLLTFRAAVCDWYKRPLRRLPRSGDGGPDVDRLQGGHRAHAARLGQSRRRRARARPGVSGLRGGDVVRGRRGPLHAAPASERFPARPRRHPRRRRAAGQAHVPELSNNPTAAVASGEFFAKVVRFAREHGIIVCHDAMYSELRFDGYRPPSFLETPGAMEVGVEFHSLSKTYSMTGWRIGFCVGNAKYLAGLGKIKTNVDSGVFQAVQEAGIAALNGPQDIPEQYRKIYQERRDVVVAGLKALGWEVDVPKAAFFVWAPVPKGLDSRTFASRLLEEVGCVVTPGVGFGPSGEGFYRVALTIDAKRLAEAMGRLKGLKL